MKLHWAWIALILVIVAQTVIVAKCRSPLVAYTSAPIMVLAVLGACQSVKDRPVIVLPMATLLALSWLGAFVFPIN